MLSDSLDIKKNEITKEVKIEHLRELYFQNVCSYIDEQDINVIKNTINDILNCGIYLDEFLEIIDAKNDHFDDFKSQFKHVIKHFELEINPQGEINGLIVVAYFARKIIDFSEDTQDIIKLCKLFTNIASFANLFVPESDFLSFCEYADDNIYHYGYRNEDIEKEIIKEMRVKAEDWLMDNYEIIPHKELFVY